MFARAQNHRLLLSASALCASPVVAIFLSANLANLGNLAFNVLFSRWMGPILFGQLATLLTLFLGVMAVLGALQLAVSQRIAANRDETLLPALAQVSKRGLVLAVAALPVLIALTLVTNIGPALGLDAVGLLPILLLCLPFALPLALARGVATGKLDARAVILSAQVEMWVRLIGAALAWHAGLGLQGVTAVIALSVLAGWLPLRRALGAPSADAPDLTRALLLAALPFALLQGAQVILMDGDVILAQALLRAEDAGHIAALGLFQRIQFFACFSLVAVLLPTVTAEVAAGRNPLRAARPVFGLYALVSVSLVTLAFAAPEDLVLALVGFDFLPAAQFLPFVSLSAAGFTLSYLLATYLAAIGDRWGIWALTIACPLQLLVLLLRTDSLATLISAKLAFQIVLAAWLLARALHSAAPRKR